MAEDNPLITPGKVKGNLAKRTAWGTMTPSERRVALDARERTNRIKDHLEQACDLLFEAWEAKDHIALGYRRWDDYIAAEFDLSRRRSYQLLHQSRVRRMLGEAMGADRPAEVNERQARSISPKDFKEIEASVKRLVEEGHDPDGIVGAVIEGWGRPTPRQARRLAGASGTIVLDRQNQTHRPGEDTDEYEVHKRTINALLVIAAAPPIPAHFFKSLDPLQEGQVRGALRRLVEIVDSLAPEDR